MVERMGKGSDLWDDSALVDAFDNAMSKYKKMHGMKSQGSSVEAGKVASGGGTVSTASFLIDENHETLSQVRQASDVKSNAATQSKESQETITPLPVKENHGVDSFGVESHAQDAEEYNKLLTEYYEIEEKRQKILEKLHQFGGYDSQYPAQGSNSGLQWAYSSTPQNHSSPATQDPPAPLISSCCPYACHCSLVPCSAFPTCGLDGTCIGKTCSASSLVMDHGKGVSIAHDQIYKTAMGAAGRAISSTKPKISSTSGIEENEENKDNDGETTEGTTSETDLGAVLNAWYSAGFYTARSLTEQSTARK